MGTIAPIVPDAGAHHGPLGLTARWSVCLALGWMLWEDIPLAREALGAAIVAAAEKPVSPHA